MLCLAPVVLALGVQAAVPLKTPQSRIEVNAHTGIVREFYFDKSRDLLISAADDKTLRIWNAADGHLYRNYRVPMATGHVGQLFTVDVAPESGIVATAGWTPNSQSSAIAAYFLDLDTGDIVRILDGLPDIVSTLRFSPEEDAVCIAFSSLKPGLRCLSYPELQPIFEDFEYRQLIRRMQWSLDGELLVAAADGQVVRYSREGQRLAITELSDAQPASSALSPDGKMLAIGMLHAPQVLVLNVETLEIAASFTPPDDGQRNLPAVTWDESGETLYAAGDNSGRRSPVYRWSPANDQLKTIQLDSELRVTWFESRFDGGLLVATEDPALIRLDADGRQLYKNEAAIHDFSGQGEQLLTNDLGSVAVFSGAAGPSVNLNSRRVEPSYQGTDTLHPPRQSSTALVVTDWRNSLAPKLNNVPLKKHPSELIRSLAIAPGEDSFILGGEWSVTRYSKAGEVDWRVELPSIAWQVNISRSGAVVVAALSDGSIRWYSYATGEEIVAAYRNPIDGEWILWVPAGYYTSSPRGDNYLGWHINESLSRASFYRAVQFERIYYRPDIVGRRIDDAIAGLPLLNVASVVDLASLSVPRVSVSQPPWESRAVESSDYLLGIELESAEGSVDELNVFVNDIPVVPFQARQALGREEKSVIRIPLQSTDNHVRVEAIADQAIGVAETRVTVAGEPTARSGKRTLYLVSVGISSFTGLPESMQLQFSANDAVAVEGLFSNELRDRYDEVKAIALTDLSWDMPTKSNIEQSLKVLAESGPDDTVVLFLASHGLSNDRGDYFFVPRDAALDDIQRVYRDPEAVTTLMGWSDFVDALRAASGRRYLIVDTCHAEQIGGSLELMSLAKRSAASSFGLLAAAADGQESQEMPSVRHGAFTYGLLTAFRAGVAGDVASSMEDVFDAAAGFVATRRPNLEKPQEPRFTAPASLREYNWSVPAASEAVF